MPPKRSTRKSKLVLLEEEPPKEPEPVKEPSPEPEPEPVEPEPEPVQEPIQEEKPKQKRQRKPKEISQEYYHSSRKQACERMLNEQGYQEYKISPKPTNQLIKDMSKICYGNLFEYTKQHQIDTSKKEITLPLFTKYYFRVFLNKIFSLHRTTTSVDEIGKRTLGLSNTSKVDIRKKIIELYKEFLTVSQDKMFKVLTEKRDLLKDFNKEAEIVANLYEATSFSLTEEDKGFFRTQLQNYTAAVEKKIQNLTKKD